MIDIGVVATKFTATFGLAADLVFGRAPGRVNLIGEHTDYNDGYVLPMAIERDIVLVGRPVAGRLVRAHSMDFNQSGEFSLDDLVRPGRPHWLNYTKGVAKFLSETRVKIPGFEVVIAGDVPIGGGLSSSAAVEVASVAFILALVGQSMDPVAAAKLARRAENEFVGVQCGIMDQFIAVMGRKDHALLIDCRDLSHRAIPTFGADYEFVICDTGVKHELGATEYHHRQAECRQAVQALARHRPEVKALRDVALEELEAREAELPEVVFRRARHVVTENNRVLAAVKALDAGDAAGFGRLMNASHESLRDDYAVSCTELDRMVELARELPGVLGARMTGGGFGGCTVNLVGSRHAGAFCRQIAERYGQATGLKACIIRSRAAQGMRSGRLNSGQEEAT